MSNVIVEKNRYTVDPLYQWDKEQELVIYGLSLASIPEIHFANDAMDKAIVRQSTMSDAGVITTKIPNSLLQKSYKIRAYVCIYEGETFKSLYTITIPVKARKMPADYTLTVSDDEVYSFNALENQIINLIDSNDQFKNDLKNICDNAVDEVETIAKEVSNTFRPGDTYTFRNARIWFMATIPGLLAGDLILPKDIDDTVSKYDLSYELHSLRGMTSGLIDIGTSKVLPTGKSGNRINLAVAKPDFFAENEVFMATLNNLTITFS